MPEVFPRAYIILIPHTCEVSTIIIPILEMKKLRFRGVKSPAQTTSRSSK